ncbi:MAG: ThuA domain-containing protein, partial [Planctomycetes bacterium]|nr:ThuA domain-containing protein [Planctomycetota bacterium]
MNRFTLGMLVALFLSTAPHLAQDPGASRIATLLITGENNHDWEFTSVEHAKTLEATGRFSVRVTQEPARVLAEEDLSVYRLFVLDYNGKRWGEEAEQKFIAAVRAGAGVVVIHAANNAFPGWIEYETLCGHCWRKGTGHGPFHAFDVEVCDFNHPITARSGGMQQHPDELYHRLVHMHDAGYRVLMRAYSSKEARGTERYEPMAVVLRFGEGRIFQTPLGHVWRGVESSRASIADPQFKDLIARGAQWAATGQMPAATDPAQIVDADPLPRDLQIRCRLPGIPHAAVLRVDRRLFAVYDLDRSALTAIYAGGFELPGADPARAIVDAPRFVSRPVLSSGVSDSRASLLGGPEDGATLGFASMQRSRMGQVSITFESPSRRVRVEEAPQELDYGDAPLALGRRILVTGLVAGESLSLPAPELSVPGNVFQVEGPARIEKGALIIARNGTVELRSSFRPSSSIEGGWQVNELDPKPATSESRNRLSADERAQGWVPLFDGQTSQFRRYRGIGMPAQGWKIEADELVVSAGGGDIISNEVYGDFEFEVEWMAA